MENVEMGCGLLILLSVGSFLFLLWAARRYDRRRKTLAESKEITYPVDSPPTTIELPNGDTY
jgi:hypothetical protein